MSTQQQEVGHDALSMDEFVGRRVHLLMWDQKLTQTGLAPRLRMDQSSLAKKLRGQRGWSLDDLRHTADVLGVTMAYLVGETDDLRPDDPKSETVSKLHTSDYKADGSSNVRPLFHPTPPMPERTAA